MDEPFPAGSGASLCTMAWPQYLRDERDEINFVHGKRGLETWSLCRIVLELECVFVSN